MSRYRCTCGAALNGRGACPECDYMEQTRATPSSKILYCMHCGAPYPEPVPIDKKWHRHRCLQCGIEESVLLWRDGQGRLRVEFEAGKRGG